MSSTALEFGLINTFRTGNVFMDTLLCMLVPLVIQRVTQNFTFAAVWSTIFVWIFGEEDETTVTRTIEVVQRFNQWGQVWDNEQKNHILQKAVSAYLAKTISFKNKNGKVELAEKPKSVEVDDAASSSATSCSSDDDDDDDYDWETGMYRSEIYRLAPITQPPADEWINVTPDIRFLHEIARPESEGEDQTKGKKVSETKTIFRFTSSHPNGSQLIDAFVRRAFAEYQEEQHRQYNDETTRYLYIQTGVKDLNAGEEGSPSNVVVAYKRYELGEDKTFENLFFSEKDCVLQLLNDFTGKKGKFAIKGFPYKLGLLLHGPPGTGKTSLIKAVAQHTKRDIVTINLAKIRTNQELMDAVFDLKFAIEGQDWPVHLSFEDVVFVLEDVDCASNVVASRQNEAQIAREEARVKRMRESQKKAEKSDEEIMVGPLLKPTPTTDLLNLSGLLNVLDGVVDCPGRIIIMTTNHPEKLDPALIRPGRVNKQLLMNYMGWREIQQMLEYYCLTTMTNDQVDELRATIEADGIKRFTPAEIEEFCAEYDEIDEILAELKTIGFATGTGFSPSARGA